MKLDQFYKITVFDHLIKNKNKVEKINKLSYAIDRRDLLIKFFE